MRYKCENCQKETNTVYWDKFAHKWICEDCYLKETPEEKVVKETWKKPRF